MSGTKMKHPVLFVICVLLTLLSLYVALNGAKITRDLTRSPVSFNELTPETAPDALNVDGLVYAANGSYGQTYPLDEEGNIIEDAPMNYYFLIPVSDNYCITLFTNDEKTVESLYELTFATEKFSKGETETIEYSNFYFSGRLAPLTEDELTHLYSWALAGKMFGAEDAAGIQPFIIPYKIYSVDRSAGLPMLIAGSALFVVFSVAMLILARKRVSSEDDD